MKRSYYDLLGVQRNAPPEALQQAYREIIARAASAPPELAETVAKEVKLARRAFAELMHPGKRAAYDAYLEAEARRDRFVLGSEPYVPDRFRHGAGSWGGNRVWATVIVVLALLGIGVYAMQFSGELRETRVQEAAEGAARARKGDEVRKTRAEGPASPAAADAGRGKPGR